MSKVAQINFTPVAGYILVEPLEASQSVEGIEIHGQDERPQLARVLKIGKAGWHEHTEKVFEAPCKSGDTILHSSVGWEDVTIEGQELRMVPFNKVLLVKS